MPFRGKPRPDNPNLTNMVLRAIKAREATWAGWIAECNGHTGMRENEGERMLAQMEMARDG